MVFNKEESSDSISGFNAINRTVLVALSYNYSWNKMVGILSITESRNIYF